MSHHPDMSEPPLPELGSLAREVPPPQHLEPRVLAALRDRSLIRPRRSRWLVAAAAMLLVLSGIAVGRLTVTPTADRLTAEAGTRFLFLLADAPPTLDEAARAEQYRLWAVDQRAGGRRVSGERLAASGIAVTRAGSAPLAAPDVQGYFVVTAANIDEAASVARSSPHVQSGGLIIVRPIDTP